ncbi:hypothetical protein LBMAG42_29000 [Deltaproteobacteria bacterium]|nr:hypothetical protein LBMAG42_29000 [Deltaproteobacteria bacterium]
MPVLASIIATLTLTPALAETHTPTTMVPNPATGAKWAVYATFPSGAGPFPAVVFVPGGQQHAFENTLSAEGERKFNRAGIAVVRYDAEGRGQSEGQDDHSGPVQQAGLRAMIDWAVAQDKIADDQVGVVTYSAGLMLAAPALVTGPHKAKFLFDWEGPPSKDFLRGCWPGGDGVAFRHPCVDPAYWAERDALIALPKLTIPYWRMQASVDHHGGTSHGHVSSAVEAAASGVAPWVRLNDLPPTTTGYDTATFEGGLLPRMKEGERDSYITEKVKQLFALTN